MVNQEIIQLSDENDQVVGAGLRNNLSYLSSYQQCCSILLQNSNQEFFVQRRNQGKSWYPGYLDVSFGGMVKFGESYIYSALRELQEEIGITDISLKPLFKHLYQNAVSKTWCQCYLGVINIDPKELKLQEDEVQQVFLMKKVEIINRLRDFTPDGIQTFLNYLKIIQCPY